MKVLLIIGIPAALWVISNMKFILLFRLYLRESLYQAYKLQKERISDIDSITADNVSRQEIKRAIKKYDNFFLVTCNWSLRRYIIRLLLGN